MLKYKKKLYNETFCSIGYCCLYIVKIGRRCFELVFFFIWLKKSKDTLEFVTGE